MPIPDLGGFWGTIQGSSFPDIDYTAVQLDKTTSISAGAAEDVHFCLDSAVLTADARQALRIMCATELSALGSPASRLTVIGHTDRSDTEQRNQELSMMRAQNTLRAVKDVLGDALRVPASHVVVQGRGEAEAIQDQRRDGERNATYRRVEVIIDGRLVLVLRAQ